MQEYNKKSIVSIKTSDKKLAEFVWKPFKKYFFDDNREEGFYSTHYGGYNSMSIHYTADELRKGVHYDVKLLVIGHEVYYYPYVTVNFIDKSFVTRSFETYNEALAWKEKIKTESQSDFMNLDEIN